MGSCQTLIWFSLHTQMALMASSSGSTVLPPVIPFETVATFRDKKCNNNVSINIALRPVSSLKTSPATGLRHPCDGMAVNPVASVMGASMESLPVSKPSLPPPPTSVSIHAMPTTSTSLTTTTSTTSKPLRVDKATITDPEEEEYEDVTLDEITAPYSEYDEEEAEEATSEAKRPKSRLSSVLESLRNVFQWRHSFVGSSRRNSENLVDNGKNLTDPYIHK